MTFLSLWIVSQHTGTKGRRDTSISDRQSCLRPSQFRLGRSPIDLEEKLRPSFAGVHARYCIPEPPEGDLDAAGEEAHTGVDPAVRATHQAGAAAAPVPAGLGRGSARPAGAALAGGTAAAADSAASSPCAGSSRTARSSRRPAGASGTARSSRRPAGASHDAARPGARAAGARRAATCAARGATRPGARAAGSDLAAASACTRSAAATGGAAGARGGAACTRSAVPLRSVRRASEKQTAQHQAQDM